MKIMARGTRFGNLAAVAALALVCTATTALAQVGDPPYVSPVGTRNTCDATVNATLSGQLAGQFVIAGPATFEWVAISNADETLKWAELQPRSIGHSGDTPYGTLTLNLDASREATNSRIEEQVPGQWFPATSHLRFQATVTASGRPGVTYRSMQEIVIENPNLGQWPHNGDVYTQVGSTDFEDVNDPGVVVFTLSNASVTVTATGQ